MLVRASELSSLPPSSHASTAMDAAAGSTKETVDDDAALQQMGLAFWYASCFTAAVSISLYSRACAAAGRIKDTCVFSIKSGATRSDPGCTVRWDLFFWRAIVLLVY